MPVDNIYPDFTNDKFDIQYARRLGLSSDMQASFVVEETGTSPIIKDPSDDDTGQFRFAVAGEDDLATQNRSFDLAAGFSFALTQLGNNHFLVDPPNGLYQLGAIPVPGSDSGLSYTYLEVNDTDQKILLQAPQGIVATGYGYGNHSGTAAYNLAVDAGGNIIEVAAGGGGGSGTVNSGLFLKAAYYITNPSGTVIDDWAGVEFNNTNLNTKIIQQATGDVGLEIKGIASQTGNYFNISTSAGTANVMAVNAAGELLINTTDKGAFKLQVEGHVYLGSSSVTVNATPDILNLGGSIADEYGGTGPSKLKIKLWDGGGSSICGIGVGQIGSLRNVDYVADAAIGGHTFWVNGTTIFHIFKNEVRLSDLSGASTTNPPFLGFGTETSSVAGQNPKIRLYNGGTGTSSYGIGVSPGQLDYMVPLTTNAHVFYINSVERVKIGGTNINTAITSGAATQVLLRLKLDSSQSANAFEINTSSGSGGDIFRVASDGKTLIGSMAQDDTETKIVVWNSTDKVLEWRDATTLGGGSVTANNGLIASGSNVQLGGTSAPGAALVRDTFIDVTSAYTLNITGSNASSSGVLIVSNTATNKVAVFGSANSGAAAIGIHGVSTSGIGVTGDGSGGLAGVKGIATTGSALSGQTTTGYTAELLQSHTSTNTVTHLIRMRRGLSSGTAAAGFGAGILFDMFSATVVDRTAGILSFEWTDATDATRTSKGKISPTLNGTTVDVFQVGGEGYVKLNPITATAASAITPAEGMLVFVSNTNGTFTAIGIWCYENGAWAKL